MHPEGNTPNNQSQCHTDQPTPGRAENHEAAVSSPPSVPKWLAVPEPERARFETEAAHLGLDLRQDRYGYDSEFTQAAWKLWRAALASLSAPKPESAEAVARKERGQDWGHNNAVASEVLKLGGWPNKPTSHQFYGAVIRAHYRLLRDTAPPRPEASDENVLCRECGQPTMHMGSICYACSHPAPQQASDEVAELASRQQPLGREHGEVLAAHLGEFLDAAPQQASAPDDPITSYYTDRNRAGWAAPRQPTAADEASAPVGVEGLPGEIRNLASEFTDEGGATEVMLEWADRLERALAQQPAAVDEVRIPAPLAERVQAALGRFTSDEGWGMEDMRAADDFAAALAGQQQGDQA